MFSKSDFNLFAKPDYAQDMVGWYDPPQLLRTGVLVLVSEQFGLHADNREIQALAALGANVHDCSKAATGDLWIDYVADSGDGFNSTYAVASQVARARLTATRDDGTEVETERGKMLVFGGDLVYPTPTGQGYDDRLISPYRDAFGKDKSPTVWALPGNHDWYDSLSAFRRLFCTEQDFGPWIAAQRRSYFAAKLPHNWWIFGIDLQLLHEIDQQQLWYFQRTMKEVGQEGRVILFSPEPYWLDRATAVGSTTFVTSLLDTLLDSIGSRLRLAIAGDLHHYQRRSNVSTGQHYITCGTGGAFLHPTHVVDQMTVKDFTVVKSFPDVEHSRRLTWGNLGFLAKNPLFGVVPAIFYLLVAWSTGLNIGETFGAITLPELGRIGLSDFREALHVGIHSAILSPIGIALYGIIFAGFIVFTQSKSKAFKWIAGTAHSFSHVIAGFLIFWAASYFSITCLHLQPKTIGQYSVAAPIILIGGWIVGSMLMGLYLLISLNVFKEHVTEAFSSLRIEDWKGFLRFRLCPNGEIELFFFGIRKVPNRWVRKAAGAAGPEWVPVGRRRGEAHPIDYVKVTR